MITQQGMQISFNHLFDALGIGFFLLIGVVLLAKPPFIRSNGSSADPPLDFGP
ncbi:MAG: hypothetical protein ACREU2_10215 [Steroidobacteraceae bacterium]